MNLKLIQFTVLRHGEKWSVKSEDLERSFADRATAIGAAIDLANHSGKNGKPAVVLVQLTDGQLEPVWTYGQDQYPLTQPELRPVTSITSDDQHPTNGRNPA